MLKEFKEFAVKGNAIDLAVGVIIGAAFGGIVTSLVKDILMPPISVLTGGLDFSNKFLVLKDAPGGAHFVTAADAVKAGAITWNYGNFITLIINFLIVAFCIFLVVRALNRMKRAPSSAPVSKDCPACAMTIPIKATRCPHCTSELAGTREFRSTAHGCHREAGEAREGSRNRSCRLLQPKAQFAVVRSLAVCAARDDSKSRVRSHCVCVPAAAKPLRRAEPDPACRPAPNPCRSPREKRRA